MAYNYNGSGSTATNPYDPMAPLTVSKEDSTMGYGIAGYQALNTRMGSNVLPSGITKETIMEYRSDIFHLMEDFAEFTSSEYWLTQESSFDAMNHIITMFGGYGEVHLDPVAELTHGTRRDIGEVSTTLHIQRYASYLAFAEESRLYDKEVTKQGILISELSNDMMIRVPIMIMYHTVLLESTHIFGACGTTSFADITTADKVSFDVLDQLKQQTMDNQYASTNALVLVDYRTFSNLLTQIMSSGVYTNALVPDNIQNAYNNNTNSFTHRGITVKANRSIKYIPKGHTDALTGYTNTDTDVSYAVVLLGQFGYKTKLNKNGVGDKWVVKDAGTVIPFDLFNQVDSVGYRIYFAARIVLPELCTTYYFATGDAGNCPLQGGSVSNFYDLLTNRMSTTYNRYVTNPGTNNTNELKITNMTATNIGGGVVSVQVQVDYKELARHAEALNNLPVYKAEVSRLFEQYYVRAVDTTDGAIYGSVNFEFTKGSDLRVATATFSKLPVGKEVDMEVFHGQNVLDMDNHFGATFVVDNATTTPVVLCAPSSVEYTGFTNGTTVPFTEVPETETGCVNCKKETKDTKTTKTTKSTKSKK